MFSLGFAFARTLLFITILAATVANASDRFSIDQAVILGTHRSAHSIIKGYDLSLSGSGPSGAGGSKTQNYNIKNFLTLGYSASSTVLENGYVNVLAETVLSFSTAEISLPEGLGIFIEPVSFKSYSIEVEPRILLSNQMFQEYFLLKLGYGLAFVRSRDKFQFGSWNFNENLQTTDGNIIISLEKNFGTVFEPTGFLEFKKFKTANHAWVGIKTKF